MTKTINSIRENINLIKKEMETLNKKYPPTQTGYNSPLSEGIIKILKRIDQEYQNELTEINVNNYNDCELYKIVYNDFVQFWPSYIQQYNAAASIHGSCAGAMNYQPPYTQTNFPYLSLTAKFKNANKFIEEFKKKEELAKKQAEEQAKKEREERKKYIEAKKFIEKYNQEQIIKQKLEYEKEQKEELASVKIRIKDKISNYKANRI